MVDAAQVLQISPNDHPPFRDITEAYALACASLGLTVRTLFLAPPVAEPSPDAVYLNLERLDDTAAAARALTDAVDGPPLLAVCHRYRAYRVLRASGIEAGRVLTVAHEFGFFKRLSRRIDRALFARDVEFAGVSPAVQVELARAAPEPLYLPNPIDHARLEAERLSRAQALEMLGVPPGGFTVGLIGRLVPKKQPELALRALEALCRQVDDARLLIIGSGELEDSLKAIAGGLPVTFCGFVPGARRALAALDVVLVTSREVEAFGMAALEAMASGVAVAVGPLPGPQSVLGSAGYYYLERTPEAVAGALLEVRRDAASGGLEARLEQGRQRALREFSVAALASRLDEVFFRMH